MLKRLFFVALSAILVLYGAAPLNVRAQGMIVNEFSNGPATTQEFVELVVVGPALNPNCGPIDIRLWLLDDNNGDFSCGACAGTGIATGHQRFANVPNWSAVPTGSIIVIYDPTIKNPAIPADDPNDSSPADGVYILPSNHAFLEASTTPCASPNSPTGVGACGTCTGNPAYASTCYTAGVSNTTWGLRNSGDAMQVRTPSGAYFHGVGYGTPGSLINGGPDGLFISGDGSAKFYAFTNAVSNDFRSVSNFAVGSASPVTGETPGTANSVQNAAWISSLQAPCLLPVTFYRELSVKPQIHQNLLEWATASEINTDHWEILRTTSLEEPFEVIATLPAAGLSNGLTNYTWVDENPKAPKVWYQLRQWDANGTTMLGNRVQILNSTVPGTFLEVWPNPSTGLFTLRGAMPGIHSVQVMDMMGRVIHQVAVELQGDYFETQLDLSAFSQGNYLLQMRGNGAPILKRVSILAR